MSKHKEQPTPSFLWVSRLQEVPQSPGVYWFSGKDGSTLYVGKAKNLIKRVRSYSKWHLLQKRIQLMVEEAAFLHWKELGSELEALLVEAELIRLHQPKYNIIQKDDKSNLYIVFTPEELPRVIAVHKQQVRELEAQGLDPKKDVFGPYQSGYRVK